MLVHPCIEHEKKLINMKYLVLQEQIHVCLKLRQILHLSAGIKDGIDVCRRQEPHASCGHEMDAGLPPVRLRHLQDQERS